MPQETTAETTEALPSLFERYQELRDRDGPIRQRDAATALGVSEAELVHAKAGHGEAVALRPGAFAGFGDLLKRMPAAGPVMVLTRNEHCVHEKHGAFAHVTAQPSMGLVVNHDIDLRLFFNHWRYGYSVIEETRSGRRESLQFYDEAGDAVHKIYKTDKTDAEAFAAIAQEFAEDAPTETLNVLPRRGAKPDRPDAEIDREGLRANWLALQDTHDFFPLLSEFGVGRQQSFRLVGEDLATPVDDGAARRLLSVAADRAAPIMCFVGNRGCIQIHTGPVKAIKAMGPWLNVLDPGFNLHMREDRIADVWVVRKPTRDGVVTSVEFFDADGFCFCMFFGERKPGQAEREDWRRLVADAVLTSDGADAPRVEEIAS